MAFFLTHLACACALGRTNAEVLANLRAGVSGLVPYSDDIPNRTVLFGAVPGELPVPPAWPMRAAGLLFHAVRQMRSELDVFFARYDPARVAIVLGASNTGVDEAQHELELWLARGKPAETMRFDFLELGTPAIFLAKELGVTGPAYVVSTACSSSGKAFASARRLIEAGVVDAALVGGVDGRCRFALNGFHALGALSAGRARPLAPDRDGINLGEGVALFTLERNCSEGVCLAAVGESSDAHHPTAPDPEGRGAAAAMRAALVKGNLSPEDVALINLHGTGTWANDDMEMKAVRRLFPSTVPFESTKPLTGHCLGAAGAIEAALCWLRLAVGDVKGPVLSNSFAFGGSNVSVLLKPVREDAA